MEEFRIYSITDRYIEYLQNQYPNVYSNKADHRTHTRKYIGTVMEINDVFYYIPMSSPKESDYQFAGDAKVMYKQKAENYAAGYVNSALDYKELEKLCKKYEK